LNSLHKSIIVPLIALVNLVLINVFKVDLGQEFFDNLTATLIQIFSLAAIAWGVYKNHHTPRADEIKQDVQHDNQLKEVIKEVAKDPVITQTPDSALKVEDLTISSPNVTVTGETIQETKPNE
jgi:hypothetical protein